ncbi:mechanosensitive ion channel family protein [Pontibacter sp. HSC-36F09]|uniref:mechanosensitive ion channel family protein n=1 Tax=Pontibacter sp. HSC-36F09 TaxID=2910966 RepID=UPI00209EC973|nr:mechanosensitive ion channel domain-containing protein [Pontibacter sp. HSC-36F09]MCP2044607.1 small conductance mechanosensitive channel [Pontibacter sp. HSC-36F09]
MSNLFNFETYSATITNFVMVYGMRLVVAVITLLVGLWVINWLNRLVYNLMVKKDVDVSLRPFLKSVMAVALRVLLIILVIAQLGVEMTSFIAILGSAGLAIGLALQGSLANFAGGVLILTIKPFRVGDYIEAQGQGGTVDMINIFNTVLKTPDNKTIFIPNGPLANSVVVNYTIEKTRRVEFNFAVSVNNDIGKVRQLLQNLIQADNRVLPDPAPAIVVTNFAEHSLTLSVRVWVEKENYWAFFWDMNEHAKSAFEEQGIQMPVPRREMVGGASNGQAPNAVQQV